MTKPSATNWLIVRALTDFSLPDGGAFGWLSRCRPLLREPTIIATGGASRAVSGPFFRLTSDTAGSILTPDSRQYPAEKKQCRMPLKALLIDSEKLSERSKNLAKSPSAPR